MNLQHSNLDRDARIVVRTLAEWENLWAAATENLQPAEEAPAVDFGRRMGLVVAMGRRGTGGFDIRIGSVYEDRERLYVVYIETSPDSGCLLTQGLTAPVSAVSVQRSTKWVTFVRRTATLPCG